jgi:formyl-CoA transferase
MQPQSPSALDGLVVVDLSRVLAGPLATMFLADLGATVIKVERPGDGDETRSWAPPRVGELSTYFASVNRNKRSIALDFEDPGDRAVAHRLVAQADVVIENFLPGKLARHGLDAAAVLAAHPRVVYCSISGFGSGVGAGLPGYDFIVQAVGGLMSITGDADGPPTKAGVALVDVITGLHAVIAIQAALLARERLGHGQHVEVSLLSSLLASLINQGTGYLNTGVVPGRLGNRHPSIAPYETLRTADGVLAVAAANDGQFARLCGCLDRPDLPGDERFASNPLRVEHRTELVAELERALAQRPVSEWVSRLSAAGVACGAVGDIGDAIGLAERLDLHPVARFGEIATLASPLRLSATPVSYRSAPPALGEGGADVLAWLAAREHTG